MVRRKVRNHSAQGSKPGADTFVFCASSSCRKSESLLLSCPCRMKQGGLRGSIPVHCACKTCALPTEPPRCGHGEWRPGLMLVRRRAVSYTKVQCSLDRNHSVNRSPRLPPARPPFCGTDLETATQPFAILPLLPPATPPRGMAAVASVPKFLRCPSG